MNISYILKAVSSFNKLIKSSAWAPQDEWAKCEGCGKTENPYIESPFYCWECQQQGLDVKPTNDKDLLEVKEPNDFVSFMWEWGACAFTDNPSDVKKWNKAVKEYAEKHNLTEKQVNYLADHFHDDNDNDNDDDDDDRFYDDDDDSKRI